MNDLLNRIQALLEKASTLGGTIGFDCEQELRDCLAHFDDYAECLKNTRNIASDKIKELEQKLADAEKQNEWISVEKEPLPKDGDYLVEVVVGNHFQRRFHVANCKPNLTIIGNRFSFDMPKVIRWQKIKPPQSKSLGESKHWGDKI